jgi:hypothetical protein
LNGEDKYPIQYHEYALFSLIDIEGYCIHPENGYKGRDGCLAIVGHGGQTGKG